jgi:hypothetical protein
MLGQSVRVLACHPQAQRRYVQMGWLGPAVDNLLRLTGQLDALVADGKVAPDAADGVRALRQLVSEILEQRPDLVDAGGSAPREYLFSHALEDEDWEAIRQRARKLHHALSGDKSVLIAIYAK